MQLAERLQQSHPVQLRYNHQLRHRIRRFVHSLQIRLHLDRLRSPRFHLVHQRWRQRFRSIRKDSKKTSKGLLKIQVVQMSVDMGEQAEVAEVAELADIEVEQSLVSWSALR